jgi:putative SOS response-associated peptidase YedK
MCGRYALYGPHSRLREQFGVLELPELIDRYNIPPSTDILVIQPSRQAELVRWGLKKGGKVINVRSDSVEKPWARALLGTRCVIPASGFYEWQQPRVPKARKQPFYISPSEAPYFAIAGALGFWEGRGVTMFTAGAYVAMAELHDRAPVLLDEAGMDTWLDPDTPDADLVKLLQPVPESAVRIRPVGLAVSNARNEGPELIETGGQRY